MVPPQTEFLQPTTHLSTPKGWKAESAWLDDLQQTVYLHKWSPVMFHDTHTRRRRSGHPSAAVRAQDRESSPVRDQRLPLCHATNPNIPYHTLLWCRISIILSRIWEERVVWFAEGQMYVKQLSTAGVIRSDLQYESESTSTQSRRVRRGWCLLADIK